MSEIKDHVTITWEQLGKLLGMSGEVHRVWSEDDADYIHVITKEKHLGTIEVPPGGYVESRSPHDRRRLSGTM